MKLDEIENAVRGHNPKPIGRHRHYSVLVPLVNKSGELHLLFEVRAENMRMQPGEICFPGGKMERGETPEETAVRETCEELCIPERSVRVISQLDYLITYSNSTMYACLGEIQEDALHAEPNRNEVKETFLVPLSFFFENEPEVYENRVVPIIAEGFPLEKIKFITPATNGRNKEPRIFVNMRDAETAHTAGSKSDSHPKRGSTQGFRQQSRLAKRPARLPSVCCRGNTDGYSWREGRSTVPIYTWQDSASGSVGEERVIWGLTARVVDNFIGILKGEA